MMRKLGTRWFACQRHEQRPNSTIAAELHNAETDSPVEPMRWGSFEDGAKRYGDQKESRCN